MNQKNCKKWIVALLLILICVIAALYLNKDQTSQSFDVTDTAMSTVVKLHLYGEHASLYQEPFLSELDNLEQTISWRISDSKVADVNAKKETIDSAGADDAAFVSWFDVIADVAQKSDGALDITTLPLAKLWDIEGEHPSVPDAAVIKEKQKLVDYTQVKNDTLLPDGMEIDMGAVGKGIALDLLWDLCEGGEYGSLSGTVSVGGSIAVYGTKPDQTAWKLGIQNPRGETGTVMGVYESESGCFISTSGDYEKYFEQDGKRYHHILDPSTGYPADSGLISVTIIIPMTDADGTAVTHANQGLLTDALSTACFILGREKGMELASEYGAQAIMVDTDYKVYVTDGLKKSFSITDETYTSVSAQ